MTEAETLSGTVVSVASGLARVRVDAGRDCDGCRSCALAALCRGRDAGAVEMDVAPPPGLAGRLNPGDAVRVRYRPAHAGLAGLALFAPALLGLAAGGWLGWRLGATDAALLSGCALGLAAGVALTWIMNRSLRGLRPRAEILGGDDGREGTVH